MKLDLGCGVFPKEGFEGVDFFSPTARHKVNLCKFPWPWEDSSIDELYSADFLEHIPDCYVKSDGVTYLSVPQDSSDKDLLCRFMDEAYRVLKPGGRFEIMVPSGMSSLGFRDPTHRRFFFNDSFYYFNYNWRESRGLGHYLCMCNFEVSVYTIVEDNLLSLNQNIIEKKCSSEWNVALNYKAVLISKK